MEFRYLLRAIRRGLALIVIFGIVGAGAGFFVAHSSPKYGATAAIAVSPPNLSTVTGTESDIDLTTYVPTQAGVIAGNVVLGQVAKSLKMSLHSVQTAVGISQQTTTDIVTVNATTSSPALSADIANTVANTYISQLTASANQLLTGAEANLQASLQALDNQLTPQTSTSEASSLIARITPLAQSIAALTATSASSIVQTHVVETATVPGSPVPRHTTIKIAVGLLAGLAVGVVASVLLSALRPMLLRSGDVEQALGIAPVAELPRIRKRRSGRPGKGGRALWEVDQRYLNEVSKLAAFVQAVPSAVKCKTVLVASLEPRSGVSLLAEALANVLNDSNQTVKLLDLPSKKERVQDWTTEEVEAGPAPDGSTGSEWSETFGHGDGHGLGNAEDVHGSHRPGEAVVGTGKKQAAQRQRLRLDMESIDADIVVMDGHSLGESVSVLSLARESDVAVLVVPVPSGNARFLGDVTHAAFDGTDSNLLVVVNAIGSRRSGRTEA